MTVSALSIRHARQEDATAIARLANLLGHTAEPDDIARRLRKLLDDPTEAVFVACDEDDQVHGYIAAKQRLMLESGAMVEIVGLSVDPDHRRGGAGRALLTAAELWTHKRGVARLRVQANSLRDDAHAFYPAMGYTRDKTQYCYTHQLG